MLNFADAAAAGTSSAAKTRVANRFMGFSFRGNGFTWPRLRFTFHVLASPHRPIRVRRVGAEDPGALEVDVVLARDAALLVLVFQAEAQELAPVPAHVGGDGPQVAVVAVGVLRVIEADA